MLSWLEVCPGHLLGVDVAEELGLNVAQGLGPLREWLCLELEGDGCVREYVGVEDKTELLVRLLCMAVPVTVQSGRGSVGRQRLVRSSSLSWRDLVVPDVFLERLVDCWRLRSFGPDCDCEEVARLSGGGWFGTCTAYPGCLQPERHCGPHRSETLFSSGTLWAGGGGGGALVSIVSSGHACGCGPSWIALWTLALSSLRMW